MPSGAPARQPSHPRDLATGRDERGQSSTSVATAILALLLSSCAASQRVHPRAAEEIARGYRYLGDGDLERAEIAFAHALEFNEDIPEALNGAGVVERRRGRVEEARRRFDHAVKVAPDFAEGHVNLGEVDLARGDPDAAEQRFRAALRIDPDLAVARLDLARALLHRGRKDAARRAELWATARREYLHLLEARPDVAEAHHDLAFMDYEAGALSRALEEYGRAVELAPDYPEALHGQCITLARLGRCAEAVRACRRCVDAEAASERCQISLRGALACEAALDVAQWQQDPSPGPSPRAAGGGRTERGAE